METQQDLLTDLETETIFYQDATTGLRFLNCIIDMFCIILLVVLSIVFFYPDFTSDGVSERLLVYGLMLFYYSLLETTTGGRTLGKFITGTKAIRGDGTAFSAKDAVVRSLCRLVPFDTLSALTGHPWHDKWTKTRVVKNR